MVLHDQHCHSYYSFDSEQDIEEYIRLAIDLKQDYFVLTDHYDLDFLKEGNHLIFDIVKQKEELIKLNNKYPNVRILQGIEIGYLKQDKNIMNEIITSNEFDVVNLSIHQLEDIDYYEVDCFKKYGIDKVLTDYFNLILNAVRNFDNFDVLSHIDYAFKTAFKINNSIVINRYERVIKEIMKELIAKDKTLELNTKVQCLLGDNHTKYILNLYKEIGGENLTLSSDSHNISRYKKDFDHYIELIKEAKFTHLIYFVKRKKYFYNF